MVKPGDEIEICGIYKSIYDLNSNLQNFFPLFKTYIEANYISKINDIIDEEINEKDKKEIIKLSKKINISKIIIDSIAPSIYGHELIKKALAVSLFGGVTKDIEEKHKIRGDINILLLGDPGTAKSQILKYILKIFPKALYTTAKGASGVGLTASVLKDNISKEWVLVGGALVLADKGICLIDEFDKMNIQDRTYIHEAMEQQTISISKAGIVTTLQARCTVIAAANPIEGKYDISKSIYENVELTDPILSRFDLICPIKDIVDKKFDEYMASNIINSNIISHPLGYEKIDLLKIDVKQKKKEILSQEKLKKYIIYARKYIKPKINNINKDKLVNFYTKIRKENEACGGLKISTRHFESLIRIAEAHSKIFLRNQVNNQDIDFSIQLFLELFLQNQKYYVEKWLRGKFLNYFHNEKSTIPFLMNILEKLFNEKLEYLKYFNEYNKKIKEISIKKNKFEIEANNLGFEIEDFYNKIEFKNKFYLENDDIICKLND